MPLILKKGFYRKQIVGQTKEYHLGPFKWSRNLFEKTFDLNQTIFNRYDCFCLLNSNLGEAFIFLKFFLSEIERKNLAMGKRTLVITTKYAHVELAKTLGIHNIICLTGFSADSYETSFTYRGKEFLVIFNHEHYVATEIAIRLFNAHFFSEMQETLKVKPITFRTRRVSISKAITRWTRIKAEKIGLRLDNFVMIIPHANSCQDLEKHLLHAQVRRLVTQGYHVFINTWETYPIKHPLIHTSYRFSLPELYVLAKHAREIVAIRCGLIEFLAEAQTPMTVVSSDFKNRPFWAQVNEEQVLSGFSLYDIAPEYKVIREITLSEYKNEILNY